MKKQVLILIAGHNASWKTTLSKKLISKFALGRINGDTIREMLISNINFYSDAKYSYPNPKIKSANKIVSAYRCKLLEELVLQNQSIIFDGAWITKEGRKE